MRISLSEQRELADYIAKKLVSVGPLHHKHQEQAAEVAWLAIEDYTGDPDSPDILEMAKARMEDEPREMGDPNDFADHYFTRDR